MDIPSLIEPPESQKFEEMWRSNEPFPHIQKSQRSKGSMASQTMDSQTMDSQTMDFISSLIDLGIPVDTACASKPRNERRKQNRKASRQSRIKKQELDDTKQLLEEVLKELQECKADRDYYKTIVLQQTATKQSHIRPPSPREERAFCDTCAGSTDSAPSTPDTLDLSLPHRGLSPVSRSSNPQPSRKHKRNAPGDTQPKWTPEDDSLLIELCGQNMTWDQISQRVPGRSSISCRLHYQNYIEKRPCLDKERDKFALVYNRLRK